jgi:GNAT superfamily N-acetyltransferase
MISIRTYRESDAESAGRLIADTYGEFNLDFASPEEKQKLLGPFQFARSTDEAHRAAIAQAIRAAMVFVAEDDGEIVGVLRGRTERIQSLFVRGDYHRRGIGRLLVERCEQECIHQGAQTIKVASTLLAVPFYLALGYKRTTGVRNGWSFGGAGLRYQPMKKTVASRQRKLL